MNPDTDAMLDGMPLSNGNRTSRQQMHHVAPVTSAGAAGLGASRDDAGDLALGARVGAQDRAAMHELFVRYHRRVKRFLARLTARQDLADEIVNDTMLVVWRRAGSFRGESRVSTWIMGIAWRQGLKSVERERRAARYPAGELDAVPSPAVDLERTDWLSNALADLSPEHRAVLELAYVGGQTCDEIASVMGCPVNTVKTRLFYARRRLRARLDAPDASSGGDGAIEPARASRALTR